jgi:hypothetical protein
LPSIGILQGIRNRKDSALDQWLNVMPQNKQVFFEGCTYYHAGQANVEK